MASTESGGGRGIGLTLSGLLNLATVFFVVLVVAELATDAGTEAILLSNAQAILFTVVGLATLKIEFHPLRPRGEDGIPWLLSAGVVAALGGTLLILLSGAVFQYERRVFYGFVFCAAFVLGTGYTVLLYRGRWVLATGLKAAPVVLACTLILSGAGVKLAVPLSLGICALPALGLMIPHVRWHTVKSVVKRLGDVMPMNMAALASALAVNAAFVLLQWMEGGDIALRYFEHWRVFAGPMTILLFPLGQWAVTHAVNLPVGQRVGSGALESLGMWLIGSAVLYGLVALPGYEAVSRLLGLTLVRDPDLLMYTFVLVANGPRMLIGVSLPLLCRIGLAGLFLSSTAVKLVVLVGALGFMGISWTTVVVVGLTEASVTIYLWAKIRRRLDRGASEGS